MNASAETARLLDILVPTGGYVVAIAEVYMDESYDDKASVFCASAYMFRKTKAKKFAVEWSRYLRKRGLPYFHMNECAHGAGHFKAINKPERSKIARKLIKLTKQYSAFGCSVTLDEKAYMATAGTITPMPQPYGFAIFRCMGMVRRFAEETGMNGQVGYFFENGHRSQHNANNFMELMFKSDLIRSKYHYESHGFIPKINPLLHPADFLSWHSRLEQSRREVPRSFPVRQDLIELVRPHDICIHYDAESLALLKTHLDEWHRSCLIEKSP